PPGHAALRLGLNRWNGAKQLDHSVSLRANITALILLVLVSAGGCGKGGDAPSKQERTKVTLQLNWKPEPQFGGFYAADVAGIYGKHGLDVTITAGGAGASTVEMFGAGTVPFAIVSGD